MVTWFRFTLWKYRERWHRDINGKLNALMKMVCKPEDELSVLCDTYGSDKGSTYRDLHTYTPEYFKLFSGNRENIKAVFECGIGTNNPNLPSSMGLFGHPGASLRVWRDYFHNAVVIGADVDKKILFEENRIHTAYIDQLNPEVIKKFFDSLNPEYPDMFDIMIDDGLHTFEAGTCLFENAVQYLNKNGYYVIEDIEYENIPQFEKYFASYKNRDDIKVEFKIMYTKWKRDNNLIVIQKIG
jgi:hypothetical protein